MSNKSESNRVNKIIVDVIKGDIVELALEIHGELLETTPVDTGWAVNNWIPSLKKPVTEPAGNPEDDPDPSVADDGIAEVLTWRPGSGPIYITNNVPYIGALNDGHSSQAPAGFVEMAVDKVLKKGEAKRRNL